MASPYFGKATFDFLADLAAHNDRDWFAAHKADYESAVKEPALRFIQDFTPHLEALSPHFHAGPRSLFRIHRDTRFSNDKRPYKTHTGIHFRHAADRDVHKPGFYLHIEPEGCFAGLGIWRPDAPTLRAVREHMAENPDGWLAATGSPPFSDRFSLEGDRLSRAPKGFDPDHPLADDLKWKDFLGTRPLERSFVASPRLPEELGQLFRAGSAFMSYLCAAVGVAF